MTDMVERLARAMLASDYPEDVGSEMEYLWWDRHGHTYLRYARAAIEAMREPTEVMVGSVEDAYDGLSALTVQYIWSGMIDAALGEGSK